MDEEVKSTSWSRPPVREIALAMAIDHWGGSGTVQLAATVVTTAETFLSFLMADEAKAKEAAAKAASDDTRAKVGSYFGAPGITVNVTGVKLSDADIRAIANEALWISRSHWGSAG